jgi:hypothetical protein
MTDLCILKHNGILKPVTLRFGDGKLDTIFGLYAVP